jgi:2-succinyl-5-enolpyruvyl-6-hydroxy-3-cyclohexene-1-carboxylate synthase
VEIHKTNISLLWGELIVEELARGGVTYFCISPGSRSTPLTLAAAGNKKIQTIICYDERAAGFHALGYARATGKPAAVICTSGTAAANYYPAVIEAHQSILPLVILSADRPPELRATAANQTIDQVKMFSSYLNWQFDVPCPDEKIPIPNLLSLIDQAIYRSCRSPAGPVHINCMFREPFVPEYIEISAEYLSYAERYNRNHGPLTAYHQPQLVPAGEDLTRLCATLLSSERNLLVLGRLAGFAANQHVLELIPKLGWPVIADISSGLRSSIPERLRLNYYDQLLLSEAFRQELKPELVLHLGGPLTSKRYANYISEQVIPNYIQVENNPYRQDAQNVVTQRFECELNEFSFRLNSVFQPVQHQSRVTQLKQFDERAQQLLDEFIDLPADVSEIGVAYLIAQHIRSSSGLFIANSMPIRDMDMVACFKSIGTSIAANRGASGIDGNLASACGYAAGLNQPVTVFIGDLALIHDLNSLELINKLKAPVILVVINNHGGGIFSFLPAVNPLKVFESHFAAPHTLGFKPAAGMFGINYYRPTSHAQFVEIYQQCLQNGKPALIEVVTDREKNLKLHQELHKKFTLLTA